MRFIKYSLLFWLACLPLLYIFGLPKLVAKLETHSRAESYARCQKHLTEQNLANVPSAVVSPQKAEEYCHCVSGNITLTTDDLLDLARRQPPRALNAALEPIVAACNRNLQQGINDTINRGPQPRSTWEPDGTETIHFD